MAIKIFKYAKQKKEVVRYIGGHALSASCHKAIQAPITCVDESIWAIGIDKNDLVYEFATLTPGNTISKIHNIFTKNENGLRRLVKALERYCSTDKIEIFDFAIKKEHFLKMGYHIQSKKGKRFCRYLKNK